MRDEPSRGLRLAGSYAPDRPGLPRGRSSLPGAEARTAQRGRLVRGMIAAVAEKGYARTTVADVVARARVSRKAFYEHFTDLRDCFFTAMDDAQKEVIQHLVTTTGYGPSDPTPLGVLRSSVRAYLTLCSQEPEYAYCVLVELPAAGPGALKARNTSYEQIAELLRLWREHMCAPGLPPISEESYLGAVGAVGELVLAHVSAGTTERLPGLTGTVVELMLRVLAVPPDWASAPLEPDGS